METSQVLENIRRELAEQGISLKQLSKLIGYSDTNVYNVFNRKTRLNVPMVEKIARAIDVDPLKLLDTKKQSIVNESEVNYKSSVDLHTNCVPREDYEFLKRQIEILNKIILKNYEKNDDNHSLPAHFIGGSGAVEKR